MGKIVKMYDKNNQDILKEYLLYSQRQLNIERLSILIDKLGIPNKKEALKKIKSEQRTKTN